MSCIRSSSSAWPIDSWICSASCSPPRITVPRPAGHSGATEQLERLGGDPRRVRREVEARARAPSPRRPPSRRARRGRSAPAARRHRPRSRRSTRRTRRAPACRRRPRSRRTPCARGGCRSMASERTIRGSPRSASSAANSSSSLSSSETPNGSLLVRAGPVPARGRAPARAVRRGPRAGSRRSPARAPARARRRRAWSSRVAAKPQPPPARTRTPTPSAVVLSTWSTRAVADEQTLLVGRDVARLGVRAARRGAAPPRPSAGRASPQYPDRAGRRSR